MLLLARSCFAACEAPDYSEKAPQRLPSDHLPNLIQIHSKVYSGGVPASVEAFEELCRLGVRTIISVDAAKPDVDSANRFGLRYVHLPHGTAITSIVINNLDWLPQLH